METFGFGIKVHIALFCNPPELRRGTKSIQYQPSIVWKLLRLSTPMTHLSLRAGNADSSLPLCIFNSLPQYLGIHF